MCTLTIIPIDNGEGFRVVTNRDEQRTRPKAVPPRTHIVHGRAWIWPEDGLAGGAWIGASDAGLTLSILNLNLTPPPELPPRDRLVSRGHIIPALGGCSTADQAMEALTRLPLGEFAPFRLVAVDFNEARVGRWDRDRLTVDRKPLAPTCMVSSGLGDTLVAPRLSLFEEFLADHGATPRMQDLFHRHSWPRRADLSVMMSRADARTVSTTSVESVRTSDGVAVAMRYTADHESVLIQLPGPERPTVEIRPRAIAAGHAR